MKRKNFGYIAARVYGGSPGDKTVGIHMKASDREALELAHALLSAMKYGKEIDITIFTYRKLRNGKNSITITSRL